MERGAFVGVGLLLLAAATNCAGRSTTRGDEPEAGTTSGGVGGAGGRGSGGTGGGGGAGGKNLGGRAGMSARGGEAGTARAGNGGDDPRGGQVGVGGAGAGGRGGAAGGGTTAEAGEGGAGGEPSVFTPDDLGSRLVLWLDAARIRDLADLTDGEPVSLWPDRSPAGNDAVQSVGARQPLYTEVGIRGLPTVTFDGSETFLEVPDDATLRWGTGDFALMAVVRGAPATITNAMIYQKSDLTYPFAGPALLVNPDKPSPSDKASMQLDASTYTLSFGPVDDTEPRLYAGTLRTASTGAALQLRATGTPEGTLELASSPNVDAVGMPAIIGHNGYAPNPGFQAFEGDISEIIAVKGAFTDQELAELEGYLIAKYDLR